MASLHRFPRLPLLCAAAIAGAGPARGQDIALQPEPTRWRLSLVQAFTDGPEDLGLVGVHYSLGEPFAGLPGMHVGVGAYAGTWGDLGGYFASGLEVGWRRALVDDWTSEFGLFAGGGGAEQGDSGNGLVLRPHVALEHPLSRSWNWRFELAFASAAGGDLDGLQVGVGVSAARELLTGNWSFAELGELPVDELLAVPQRLDASIVHVDPSSGTSRPGRPAREFDLFALRTHFAVGRSLYVPIEYASAVHGDAGGYRQIMLGLGEWGPRFTPHVVGVKEVLVGAGGGADYQTGGGALAQVNAGLEFPFSNGWSAHVKGGYQWSFGGDFDGWVVHVGASYAPVFGELPRDFRRSRVATEGLSMDEAELGSYVVSLKHKTVSLGGGVLDEAGFPLDDRLQLAGVGLEREVLASVDVLVNLFSAWDGDVGGYQEVQVGGRYRLEVFRPWQTNGEVYLQYLAGSGSGGVDNRTGLFHEFGAGWRFSPSEGLWVALEASRAVAESGSYEGDAFGVHVGWAFGRARVR
jgi:hypothetical protein